MEKNSTELVDALTREAIKWQALAQLQAGMLQRAAEDSSPYYNFRWRDLALIGTVCFLFILLFFGAVFVASSPNLGGPKEDGSLTLLLFFGGLIGMAIVANVFAKKFKTGLYGTPQKIRRVSAPAPTIECPRCRNVYPRNLVGGTFSCAVCGLNTRAGSV